MAPIPSLEASISTSFNPVKVRHQATITETKVLIDPGADESLMDLVLAEKLRVKTEVIMPPNKASALTVIFYSP